MKSSISGFINAYRHSTDERWQRGLIEHGLTSLDMPVDCGGPGWSRPDKLAIISALCAAGCPVMPQALGLMAPLILKLGSEAMRARFLPALQQAPETWLFLALEAGTTRTPVARGIDYVCLALADDKGHSTLFIAETKDLPQKGNAWQVNRENLCQLGDSGQAIRHLAECTSPLYEIQTLMHTLQLVLTQIGDRDEEVPSEVALLEVDLAALEAMYLQDDHGLDQQIALKTSQVRLSSYTLLFQSLGYYALIDPDPRLSSNEAVPYRRERDHLKRLRTDIDRNEMLQKDLIYQHHLEKSET